MFATTAVLYKSREHLKTVDCHLSVGKPRLRHSHLPRHLAVLARARALARRGERSPGRGPARTSLAPRARRGGDAVLRATALGAGGGRRLGRAVCGVRRGARGNDRASTLRPWVALRGRGRTPRARWARCNQGAHGVRAPQAAQEKLILN